MSELPHVFCQTIRDANGTQFDVEYLYQVFKARLMAELMARKPGHSSQMSASLNTPTEFYRLVEPTKPL